MPDRDIIGIILIAVFIGSFIPACASLGRPSKTRPDGQDPRHADLDAAPDDRTKSLPVLTDQ